MWLVLMAVQILAEEYYQVRGEENHNEHVPELQTSASTVPDKKHSRPLERNLD